MKITIEFDSESPNFNKYELEETLNASKLCQALVDLNVIVHDLYNHQYDFKRWKSNNPNLDMVDYLDEQFSKVISDNNISHLIYR